MATLDLRDPEIRLEAGLLAETVSAPYQQKWTGAEHRSRAETESIVINALHQLGPMSRRQLADTLNRAKSPRLVAVLESMVDAGIIIKGVATCPLNGREMIVYGVEG
jgi:hypothetical protein